MPRYLITGQIPQSGFGLDDEPKRFVVEASSLDRACAVVRQVCPDFQMEQARLADPFEGFRCLAPCGPSAKA